MNKFRLVSVADSGRGRIVCRGAYKKNRAYDWPHPSESSDYRKINAHLKIDCNGPGAEATFVYISSVMHSKRREGGQGVDTGSGEAKTGGDLRCVRKKRPYQAHGYVHVKFPPRHTPSTGTAKPKSVKRVFKKNRRGICRRP